MRSWRLFRSTEGAGLGARGELPATQGYRVAGHGLIGLKFKHRDDKKGCKQGVLRMERVGFLKSTGLR